MKRRKASIVNKAKKLAQNYIFEELIRDPITGLLPYRIQAPERFTIGDAISRARLLIFLEEIRHTVLIEERSVFIDFSKTKKMIADGTLLFYAEIHRLIQVTRPRQLIRCSYPKDKIVEQVLQHVKVFEVLGKRERMVVVHDTVRHWHSQTGTKHQGEKIEAIRKFYEGNITEDQDPSKLYNGISEAMTNCRHAYPDPESLQLWGVEGDARWWMFSHEFKGVLWVTMYDLGIGIPASLVSGRKWSVEQLKRWLSNLGLGSTDGNLINIAFQQGSSVTNEAYRGKGLPEVQEVLRQHGRGILRVYSGRGYYQYNAETGLVQSGDFIQPICGTMISWNIPVQDQVIKSE